LRRQCTGHEEDEQSEDMMLEISSRMYSLGVNTQAATPKLFGADDPVAPDPLTGKLKNICPSLFFSLTSWEKNLLDNSTTLVSGLSTSHLGVSS
jgi:hypothetical protein